jgi:hypothetical protein
MAGFADFLVSLRGARSSVATAPRSGQIAPGVTVTGPGAQERLRLVMQAVTSSNVAAIGYDSISKIMQIEFLNGGVYQYEDITPEFFAEFQNAPSKGKFVAERIRPLSRQGIILYKKISGPGKRPNSPPGGRMYTAEPPEATRPGGYPKNYFKPGPLPNTRLGRVLARDRTAAQRPAQQPQTPPAARKPQNGGWFFSQFRRGR